MKILKPILIGFLVVVVLAFIGAYIFIKTFDLNRYRPEIIREATKALHRPVDIKNLKVGLSFEDGLALEAEGLTVADLPQFQSGQLLKVDTIHVGVDVEAYLKDRSIRTTNVRVISPRVTVIRTKEGQLNLQSLSTPPASLATEAISSSTQSAQSVPSTVPLAVPPVPSSLNSLFVDSINVTNGVVSLTDQSFSPELLLNITKIGINIEKFSLVNPFPFKMKAAALGPMENVFVEGWAQLDTAKQSVKLKDVKISRDLASVSLEEAKRTFAAFLKGVNLPEELKGNMSVSIKEATLSPRGIGSLSLDGALREGLVKLQELAVPISGITANINATPSVVTLKNFLCQIGSGSLQGSGVLNDYLGAQKFSLTGSLEAIELSQALNQKDYPVKIQGRLLGQFSLHGQGVAPGALAKSLQGEGTLKIKDGKLVDLNVLKTVFSKMSMIPNLVDKIEANLPERYRKILQQKDTSLRKVEMAASMSERFLTLNKIEMQAEGFSLIGSGTVDFDQNLNLSWSLLIEKDLSASMVAAVQELQYIVTEAGQIQIPVRVTGKATAPVMLPDIEYLGKRILANRGKEELNKVLDKVFGEKKSSPDSQNPSDGQEKHPERKVIEDILDTIFK